MNDAWLAGIFEGEGSLTQCGAGSKTFQLRIKMTDKDVLERVLSIAGCGTLLPVKVYKEHHKPTWQWSISARKDVTNVLLRLLPFLGLRRTYKVLNTLDSYDDC